MGGGRRLQHRPFVREGSGDPFPRHLRQVHGSPGVFLDRVERPRHLRIEGVRPVVPADAVLGPGLRDPMQVDRESSGIVGHHPEPRRCREDRGAGGDPRHVETDDRPHAVAGERCALQQGIVAIVLIG